MPSVFLKSDLLRCHGLGAVAHCCNCAGAMGKGIAVEFRTRFPKMYAEYKRRCADGRFKLGDVFMWTEAGNTVFNLGTQATWRTKAELSAIEKAVGEMVRLAVQEGIARVGLPRIGAGLGGLPWTDVRAVLGKIGNDTNVELVSRGGRGDRVKGGQTDRGYPQNPVASIGALEMARGGGQTDPMGAASAG